MSHIPATVLKQIHHAGRAASASDVAIYFAPGLHPDSILNSRETKTIATKTLAAATASTTSMGLGSHLADPGSILKEQEKLNIQILSAVAATISLVSCLVTIYWFLMMRRNFRRTYVSNNRMPLF